MNVQIINCKILNNTLISTILIIYINEKVVDVDYNLDMNLF